MADQHRINSDAFSPGINHYVTVKMRLISYEIFHIRFIYWTTGPLYFLLYIVSIVLFFYKELPSPEYLEV